jgi:acetyl esterase/lipase
MSATQTFSPIDDWDDAYANARHIEGGDAYPARWAQHAEAFRIDALRDERAELDLPYGEHARQRYDFFWPQGRAKGVFVFLHGGYWIAFDKSFWSHLASGALARGWAVAMPSYRLAPEASIGDIARDAQHAIEAASQRAPGPVRIAGHSAGGHLATRALCEGTTIGPQTLARIAHVVSISGLHDLRPLSRTAMNQQLRLDARRCADESPALLNVAHRVATTCWVGQRERPEFLRQSALLATVWAGLGVETQLVIDERRHHFDVIEPLCEPGCDLTRLCAP